MTDKELRKLSRLDLLELLLEQTKINEQLKAENQQLKSSSGEFNSIENLKKLNKQLSTALSYVDLLASSPVKSQKTSDAPSDKNIYNRIMYFYHKNDDVISTLPDDLQADIRARLRGVKDGKE